MKRNPKQRSRSLTKKSHPLAALMTVGLSVGLSVGLLFGCTPVTSPDASSPGPSTSGPTQSGEEANTSTPAPPAAEPLPPTPLEVNGFSLEELLDKSGYGCSILLKRNEADENFILYENYDADGAALMKIEGGWVEFLPENEVIGINEPVRTFASEDGLFRLRLDTPAGENVAPEVINIPEATIEIQYEEEPATVLSAVGEAGC